MDADHDLPASAQGLNPFNAVFKQEPALGDRASFHRHPPHPCTRPRIDAPLATGVRAIGGLLTCGKGQRMGIFSGSG